MLLSKNCNRLFGRYCTLTRGFFCTYQQKQERAGREPKSNDLGNFIRQKIKSTGPVSVHDYMQMCAGSSFGYYSKAGTIFGERGDFITSPELSQVFGEILGVWCYYELANTGHKDHWHLVEMGPGTGQLASDILRVLRRFRESKLSVHFVETSDLLIEKQELTLCGNNGGQMGGDQEAFVKKNSTQDGIEIFWYKDLDYVPFGFSVFLAHEFLDALPVHQFKRVGQSPNDWREVFVDIDPSSTSNTNNSEKFRYALSPVETIHVKGLLPDHVRQDSEWQEFEVCPAAGLFINRVAERMTRDGGLALAIDYGHDGLRKTFSFRSYYKHKLADPLENPGYQDLTADVDFAYLKSLVEDRLCVYGPREQVDFLNDLGFYVRLNVLLDSCKNDAQLKRDLLESSQIIMDKMGKKFRAMAFFPKCLQSILRDRGGPSGFGFDMVRRTQSQSTTAPDQH